MWDEIFLNVNFFYCYYNYSVLMFLSIDRDIILLYFVNRIFFKSIQAIVLFFSEICMLYWAVIVKLIRKNRKFWKEGRYLTLLHFFPLVDEIFFIFYDMKHRNFIQFFCISKFNFISISREWLFLGELFWTTDRCIWHRFPNCCISKAVHICVSTKCVLAKSRKKLLHYRDT